MERVHADIRDGPPARIDDYAEASCPGAHPSREWGVRLAAGAPITVEGRLSGVMFVGSRLEQPLPADTEDRLAGFTELVATAVVSLALQLRAAQAAVPPGELAAQLDQIADELTGVLDELREFARGIHPAILADGGLGSAVKTLARRCPIPVDLDVPTRGRLPEPVEVCAYYGLKDRAEALGGQFALHSRPGEGTSVTAQLPLAAGGRHRPSRMGG